MTDQTDSMKFEANVKTLVDSMLGQDISTVVTAIGNLVHGATVTDDGEVPLKGHTKTKMTILYPDGSKGAVMMRTARSRISKPMA